MDSVSRREILGSAVILGGTFVVSGSSSLASAGRTRAIPADSVVRTANGTLRGFHSDGVHKFLGVHYGETTAGPGRFQPATPVKPWKGLRDAKAFGNPCIQDNRDLPIWVDEQPMSEDCLALNVWVPTGSTRKKPVMVWIHGGYYTVGSAGIPPYDGSTLAKRGDVVVVGVNHRLNGFGYMYLGGLSQRFASSGNLGQMDLVEALRWIRDNIAQFGGDPDNVTVFGESGGGFKISYLLGMPAAKGLFHKAILQSGAVSSTRTAEAATHEARLVLDQLGLRVDQVEHIVDVPAAKLLEAFTTVESSTRQGFTAKVAPFSPVIEPHTLPFDLTSEAAMAHSDEVTILLGGTTEEYAYFAGFQRPMPDPRNDDEMRTIIAREMLVDEAKASALITASRAIWPNLDRQRLTIRIESDLWMWGDIFKLANRKSARPEAKVYMYDFAWKTPFSKGLWALAKLRSCY